MVGPRGTAPPRLRRYPAGSAASESRDTSAIQQHALAVGKDHQQAITLADIDGRNFQLPATRSAGTAARAEARASLTTASGSAPPASARQRRGNQSRRERQGKPQRRRGDTPVRLQGGVPGHDALRKPANRREARYPHPAGKDRHEADGHDQAHQRHHEGVGREAGESHAVEVDHHGQRQAHLHHRRNDRDFIEEKQHAAGVMRRCEAGGEAQARRVAASRRISMRNCATRGSRWRSRPASSRSLRPAPEDRKSRESGAWQRPPERQRPGT